MTEVLFYFSLVLGILFVIFFKFGISKKAKHSNQNLKKMGDNYEKQIGLEFEKKDSLVIYNGLIKGYKDRGIDILVLSKNKIELIQCKNWHKKILTLEALETISAKLDKYTLDFYTLSADEINKHLTHKKKKADIKAMIAKTREKKLRIKKTLYLASADVIENKAIRKTLLYKNIKIIIKKAK